MEINVLFKYEDTEIPLQCPTEDIMRTKFEEFINTINPDTTAEEYRFYYDEKELDPTMKFADCKEICDKIEKEITIVAIKKLRIKCPKCNYNECIINLSDHHISFYGCEHKHSYSAMYDDYGKSQEMLNYKIKCCSPGCKKNQKNNPRDFFICLKCTDMLDNNKSYCYECNLEHSKLHKTVRFNDKSYYCFKHCERFIEYCFNCKQNICKDCKNNHKSHIVKSYDLMIPNEKEMKKLENKLEEINIFESI